MAKSQSFTVLSKLPLAIVFPSGLMATDQTALLCSVRVYTIFWVDKSHNFMVESVLPLTKYFPLAVIAKLVTQLSWEVRI